MLPDRTFHNLKASKSGDRRILCSSEMRFDGYWSSEIEKGSVDWSASEINCSQHPPQESNYRAAVLLGNNSHTFWITALKADNKFTFEIGLTKLLKQSTNITNPRIFGQQYIMKTLTHILNQTKPIIFLCLTEHYADWEPQNPTISKVSELRKRRSRDFIARKWENVQ